MEQATQPATPTAPNPAAEQDADHAAYERAKALAGRLVDHALVIPDTVETRRELGTDVYGVRLHFGTGLTAGRGVLETASHTSAEATRDDIRPGVVWIETRTTVDGIPLIARALTTAADADQLLHASSVPEDTDGSKPESDTEVTQPLPTVSTGPGDVVIPAVIPVTPLATKAEQEDGK